MFIFISFAARLQNSQILKTQLAQQTHSPLGSPNSQVRN